MFVQNNLPSSLVDGIRDGLGKQPDLFDQLDEGQANELQGVHLNFLVAVERRSSCR